MLELRGKDAVVAVGVMKLTVPANALTKVDAPPAEPAGTIIGDLPDVEAKSEVDLRGMRVDEIDAVLMQAVDAAIRADFRSLRIIHGKGTGALRAHVAELLQKDTRIVNQRLGAWNEGGTGVTVAEFG